MQEMQEMQVRSLDWEDPLEEEMATHSGILAWKIPWTEEPGGFQSMGSGESDMTECVRVHTHVPVCAHTRARTHTHTGLIAPLRMGSSQTRD